MKDNEEVILRVFNKAVETFFMAKTQIRHNLLLQVKDFYLCLKTSVEGIKKNKTKKHT